MPYNRIASIRSVGFSIMGMPFQKSTLFRSQASTCLSEMGLRVDVLTAATDGWRPKTRTRIVKILDRGFCLFDREFDLR